jgi:hypothetical protein
MVNLRWIVAAALFGSEFSTVSVAAISADAASIHLASRQAQVQACTALLGDDLKQFVFYPTDAEYAESLATYYSGSVSAIKPSCIFRPDTPNRVALAVSALTRAGGNDWAVAVRGGGHAFFPAANNVNKGVVIDLSKMNSIQFTPCTAGRPCQASNPKGVRKTSPSHYETPPLTGTLAHQLLGHHICRTWSSMGSCICCGREIWHDSCRRS